MKRTSSFLWTWMVAAAAFACVPARGQDSCATTITCWSSIDVDSYGNITGASATEEPYYYYLYGWDAYVEGELVNGSEYALIDDVEAYDEGWGYAEADTSGTASAGMEYVQNGYHWILIYYDEYADEYLGSTQASTNWAGPCDFPTGESSADGNAWNNGLFFRIFYATVSDGLGTSFSGRQVYEVFGGGDNNSTCPDGTYIPGLFLGKANLIPIDGNNQYLDAIGIDSSDVYLVINGEAASPCGFTAYQEMWMTCPAGDLNYVTNYINVNVGDGTNVLCTKPLRGKR